MGEFEKNLLSFYVRGGGLSEFGVMESCYSEVFADKKSVVGSQYCRSMENFPVCRVIC